MPATGWRFEVVAGVLAVAAAGAAAALLPALHGTSGALASTSGTSPLPTWEAPGDSVRALSVTGRLVLDADGCLRLQPDDGSGPLTPVWPTGHVLVGDTVGSPGDTSSARVGGQVTLGGGSGAEHDDSPCGGSDEAPAFEVDQVISAR